MTIANRVLVTGAGGFIGHHLVSLLKAEGYWVRGADIKRPEFEPSPADEFQLLDLRCRDNALKATCGMTQVYNLAADMGGIGYITAKLADIARNNVLINAHMLEASRIQGVERFLFSSSACVYAGYKQSEAKAKGLREEDAYPADPEPGYGWEKLFSEQLCSYYFRDFGFDTRIVRLHNVYGPLCTYEGGKEKAPAAICRKVALASENGHIDVWGDGAQSRSFMYISDCVEGMRRIMASDHHEPLNLGTEEMVSVDELIELVCDIAGKNLVKRHDLSKPQGVRGRNSDNTRLRNVLGWEPQIRLRDGLRLNYIWIEQELRRAGRLLRIPVPQLNCDALTSSVSSK
jgi:GDP-D-mannose 3', 5'-epimerase